MENFQQSTIALVMTGLILLLATGPAAGQKAPRQAPGHNLESFDPLDFPDPNRYRTADGRPGPPTQKKRARASSL